MNKEFWKRILHVAGAFLTALLVCTSLVQAKEQDIPSIPGLIYDHSMELVYAEEFKVDYFEGDYALITIGEKDQFLVVPENREVPENLDETITVLQKPVNNIYLVATSAMDLFRAIDGIDAIRLSGTKEDGWYIKEAKEAMADGSMLYAGKYNAPDYELILNEGCSLAVESTMIYHNPEVKEKLEQFGIPVLVERSSYESHPLGAIDGIDAIRLSGTKEDGWYIKEAKEAMADGSMLYAGKYNAPDYELILNEGCSLAVESTMIYHNPEVKEKLEQFGIPVLVERSSYESHPLGRTEWMKLYGVLLGKEKEAQEVFDRQAEKLSAISKQAPTGKKVAFFYINSVGTANVRKSNDYVSNMIELAGGTYVPETPEADDNALSTMNMQMEEFYARAKDADYIIYNSTIDGELASMSELLKKSSLLEDFKAVKEGNVWCTEKNLFQETTGLGTMIADIHDMLTQGEDGVDKFTYMYRLK